MQTLRTKNLVLDEISYKDGMAFLNIAERMLEKSFQDPNYYPYYAFLPDPGQRLTDKVADFLIRAYKEKKENPRQTYRYAVRKDGQLIGSVAVNMFSVEKNGQELRGDLGYFIDPQYGRNGLMTEAVEALLHTYFAQFEELDVTAHPKNAFSCNLIRKIGGVETVYHEQTGYHNEPRQAFVVSRHNFINHILKTNRRLLLTNGNGNVR